MEASNGGGGITPGGRFDRMEGSLTRIEAKLDSKVGQEEFRPVLRRVELLEAGETPLGKVLLTQFTGMQQQLSELLLHGSQNAQAAGRRVGELETKVAGLAKSQEAQETLTAERRDRDSWRFRAAEILLSVVSVSALVVGVLNALNS